VVPKTYRIATIITLVLYSVSIQMNVCVYVSKRCIVCPGDYRECAIVLWSTYTYTVLTSTKTSQPIHELKWDPYTVNEFASVGDAGTLSFWLLDETQAEVTLSVHEAQLPHDLLGTHHMVSVHFTYCRLISDIVTVNLTNMGNMLPCHFPDELGLAISLSVFFVHIFRKRTCTISGTSVFLPAVCPSRHPVNIVRALERTHSTDCNSWRSHTGLVCS